MAQPTTDQLRSALNLDLRKVSPEGLENVVDDATRRVFTARIAGATMQFDHRQPDLEFWNGIKYYGSGASSRIRFRRSSRPVVVKAKAARKRRVTLAPTETPAREAGL